MIQYAEMRPHHPSTKQNAEFLNPARMGGGGPEQDPKQTKTVFLRKGKLKLAGATTTTNHHHRSQKRRFYSGYGLDPFLAELPY